MMTLTPNDCVSAFNQICTALKFIHREHLAFRISSAVNISICASCIRSI